MKLVFALYKYFPFGGLQKDMLAIANECVLRGHEVSIYCCSWEGEYPENVVVNILPVKAFSNHAKNSQFAKRFLRRMKTVKPDLIVGFNKIPGINVYYAADSCFRAKLYRERPWFYRLIPRYQKYVQEEADLFDQNSDVHILAISKPAIDEYRDYYQTHMERFSLLTPGISRDRINIGGERQKLMHKELGLGENKRVVLMIGSGFRTKGLDRAISSIAALPADIRRETHLVIAGEDNAERFIQQARRLSIEDRVHFLGGRKDIPELLCSADVLIHPAYRENTGTVLLEAAVACTPVITTDVCGYSHYIENSNLGIVLRTPFRQAQLDDALYEALTSAEKIKQWRNNGRKFAQSADIYDMPRRAAEIIERVAKQKGTPA